MGARGTEASGMAVGRRADASKARSFWRSFTFSVQLINYASEGGGRHVECNNIQNSWACLPTRHTRQRNNQRCSPRARRR